MNILRKLLVVVFLLSPMVANAEIVEITGHGTADGLWDIQILGPTSYLDSTAELESQIWWGDATLAEAFASAAGTTLGFPNNQSTKGPHFAYGLTPVTGGELIVGFRVANETGFPIRIFGVGLDKARYWASATRVDDPKCSAPISALSQTDPSWRDEQYDGISETINAKGCALTSLAMAINAEPTANITDPLRLNDVAAYSNEGGIIFGASTTRHQNKLEWVDRRYENWVYPNAALDFIRQGICEDNRPVVLHLPNEGHYVTAYEIDGDQLTVIDPDGGFRRTIYMSENWATRGYVVDPPETHGIFIALDNGGALTLVATNGNETGYRDAALGIVKDIPNSEYSIDWINNDVTGEEADYRSHNLAVYRPEDGAYQLLVHPFANSLLNIDVFILASDGTTKYEASLTTIATVGETKTFDLEFNKLSDVPTEVRPAATFESVSHELRTAFELGLIFNEQTYRLLDVLISVSAEHALEGRPVAVRSVLAQVLRTIEGNAGGDIDPDAGMALIASINSLMP
jgi:hypothetical protein